MYYSSWGIETERYPLHWPGTHPFLLGWALGPFPLKLPSFLSVLGMGGPLAALYENQGC